MRDDHKESRRGHANGEGELVARRQPDIACTQGRWFSLTQKEHF
jgi:hypothetical protein